MGLLLLLVGGRRASFNTFRVSRVETVVTENCYHIMAGDGLQSQAVPENP